MNTMTLNLSEVSQSRNLPMHFSGTMAWTNGAPNLCTSTKMNELEIMQPSQMMSAPTQGP